MTADAARICDLLDHFEPRQRFLTIISVDDHVCPEVGIDHIAIESDGLPAIPTGLTSQVLPRGEPAGLPEAPKVFRVSDRIALDRQEARPRLFLPDGYELADQRRCGTRLVREGRRSGAPPENDGD